MLKYKLHFRAFANGILGHSNTWLDYWVPEAIGKLSPDLLSSHNIVRLKSLIDKHPNGETISCLLTSFNLDESIVSAVQLDETIFPSAFLFNGATKDEDAVALIALILYLEMEFIMVRRYFDSNGLNIELAYAKNDDEDFLLRSFIKNNWR